MRGAAAYTITPARWPGPGNDRRKEMTADPPRLAPLRRNIDFLGRWLRNPRAVGAVAPSGRSLASAMVAGIDLKAAGSVIELGGGTGSITAALLEAGVPGDQLVVIERDPVFAAVLQKRFPEVRVLEGDAVDLRRLLRKAGVGPARAVVSGLPLLSMPDRVCLRIISESVAALDAGGVLLQFTYGPASPVSRRIAARVGLRRERIAWVVDNFPPASVWRYRPSAADKTLERQSA